MSGKKMENPATKSTITTITNKPRWGRMACLLQKYQANGGEKRSKNEGEPSSPCQGLGKGKMPAPAMENE